MTVIDHPELTAAEARGDLAERSVDLAAELAWVVRDEGREGIGAWMDRHGIPAEAPVRALLVALAAMVPVDATKDQMLSWVTWDEHGRPLEGMTPVLPIFSGEDEELTPYEDCGTIRAWYRHARAGGRTAEAEACGCAQAYRDHRKARNAALKAAPSAA